MENPAQWPRQVPASRIECRFVYEGGIKGEWVSLEAAMRTWITPAPGYTVERAEFRELEHPVRRG